MKKVFLTLALIAAMVVTSCNKVQAPASISGEDTIVEQVDSISVDSASLEVPQIDTVRVSEQQKVINHLLEDKQ